MTKEEKRAYNKAYRATHKDERKAYSADYYRAHKSECKAYDANYYAAHKDKASAKNAAYNAAHREERVAKQAARHSERRAKALEMLGSKCVDCGSKDELDFDHIDPSTKSFRISRRLRCQWAILETELAKCALRCRECHIKKTARENPDRPQLAKMLSRAPRGGSMQNKIPGARASFGNSLMETSLAG